MTKQKPDGYCAWHPKQGWFVNGTKAHIVPISSPSFDQDYGDVRIFNGWTDDRERNGFFLTIEELEAHERKVWEAAKHETLDGHPQIDGYKKTYKTFRDWKEEQPK